MCWGETTRYKVWVMSFIFKTSSLEFSPLSICIKQDVLTDNKPSVFKNFMFWGLTIPDSANQGYVSDLFLHKQLETYRIVEKIMLELQD